MDIYSAISWNNKNEQVLAQDGGKEKGNGEKLNLSSGIEKKVYLDNSGYLLLEQDSNADDAKVVANRTQGIMKGELYYPVRDDEKKVVYLIFDDEPLNTNTSNVLNILNKYNIKETFLL